MDRLLISRRASFSLLEILITLVILAFRLLGLLGISMLSKQNRLDSLAIHQAGVLAQNLPGSNIG